MNTKNNKNFKKKKIRQPIDKNQLLAYILAGLMIFWTVASVFGFIAYGRTKKEKASNVITASAMTVEQYEQGAFFFEMPLLGGLICQSFTGSGDLYSSYVTSGHWILRITQSGLVSFIYEDNAYNGGQYSVYDLTNNIATNCDYVLYDINSSLFKTSTVRVTCTYSQGVPTVSNTLYNEIYAHVSFIPVEGQDFFGVSYDFFFLDESDILKLVGLVFIFDYAIPFAEETRLTIPFYGDIATDSSTGVSYYDIPVMGFPVDEFTQVYLDGGGSYANGYRDGKDYGYQLGKDEGFAEGVASANKYSFDGLLSAIFDVPVRTFTSLFDFDILGVNLTTFFLSLLTLAGVLAVVRMLL